MSTTPRRWDKHEIKAEIGRRGSTLLSISLAAGLDPSACRVALYRPLPGGEKAIAEFLGVTRAELWPDRHGGSSDSQAGSNPTGAAAASPNGKAA